MPRGRCSKRWSLSSWNDRMARRMRSTRKIRPQRSQPISGMLDSRSIQPQRQKIHRRITNVLTQLITIANRCQRMKVGNEKKGLLLPLQSNVLADCTKVVARVKTTRGLDTG